MGYQNKSHSHRPAKGRGSYQRKAFSPEALPEVQDISEEDDLAEIKLLIDGLEALQLRKMYE